MDRVSIRRCTTRCTALSRPIRTASTALRPESKTRRPDRKSTRLNSSHSQISYAVFCLKISACYLQTESPFPVRTRLQLMMKVRQLELQIEGIVRVMHPSTGMGVEFMQRTSSQQSRVQE